MIKYQIIQTCFGAANAPLRELKQEMGIFCFRAFVLQRHVFSALGQISKHSVDLAEAVVVAEVFPAALTCLRDPDECVRKNVATLMREVVKHTPEVARAHTRARTRA